jgi:hypothetical protein
MRRARRTDTIVIGRTILAWRQRSFPLLVVQKTCTADGVWSIICRTSRHLPMPTTENFFGELFNGTK